MACPYSQPGEHVCGVSGWLSHEEQHCMPALSVADSAEALDQLPCENPLGAGVA